MCFSFGAVFLDFFKYVFFDFGVVHVLGFDHCGASHEGFGFHCVLVVDVHGGWGLFLN